MVRTRRGAFLVSGCCATLALVVPAAPGAPVAGSRLCRVSQLRIVTGPVIVPKTGQQPLSVVLTNHGARFCTLDGYPRVTLVAADGKPLPFRISHGGDQMVTARAPAAVVVPPGREAFFALNKYRCDRGDRSVPKTLEIGLPSRTAGGVTLALRKYPILAYCGKHDPGSIVTVSPFVAKLRAALSH